MNLLNLVIATADATDVDDILALAERNSPESGGELSVRFTREEIAASMAESPAVVARRNGAVIGFVLTRERQGTNPAIVDAMLRAYAGSHNAYVYGPVCVEAAARGMGVAALMFAELRKLLPGRQGILFIKASNEPSLRAHRKMGMQQVGEFTFRGTRLIIFAYDA